MLNLSADRIALAVKDFGLPPGSNLMLFDDNVRSARASSSAAAATSMNRFGLKLGINAKLQIAFGAVAGTTLVAAAVAILSFSAVERGVKSVAGRDVPSMIDAMRLSVISGEISAAAARLVSAKVAAEQEWIGMLINERSRELTVLMERLREQVGDSDAYAKVQSESHRLQANLRALENAISERSELSARLEARLDAVHKMRTRISEQLAPIVDDSYFDVMMATEEFGRTYDKNAGSENAVKRPDAPPRSLVPRQIDRLRNALEISAQTHLIMSLISEGSGANESAALVPIQDRFKAASHTLGKAVATLRNAQLKNAIDDLLRYGQDEANVFVLRRRVLDAVALAERTIGENVAIQGALDGSVGALVGRVEASVKSSATGLVDELDRNRTLLLVVALTSILTALGIGVFYVRRRLVRRLTSIADAMRRLSAGDVDHRAIAVDDHDEVGEMARSLGVFRAGEIERRGLAERERAEQLVKGRRAAAIEQMISAFRANVTAVVATVSEHVARMETTARTLSSIAGGADQDARTASASSDTTSSNIRTVAAAADELGASIREISEKALQAKGTVERASEMALSANEGIGQLSDGTKRIGDVVKLIRDIAAQTNLLALNATIEAARAGEAGRGFAVVASEVKTLATETATATEDISAQIGAIQLSTAEAVGAIGSIGDVMGEVSRFAVGIAAAVEQQSAATQEIARNIQAAAGGAHELAGGMANLTDAIRETNYSAASVLEASQALTVQASELEEAVDAFLANVAAA
jgi:methyl-accepting chemotaxis protein